MAFETRLELKLSQKLVLTPQLQQAIKLLQLTQLELSQAINEEMLENPFLDDTVPEPEPDTPGIEKEDIPESTLENVELEVPTEGLVSFDVDDYFSERSSDGRDLGYFNKGIDDRPTFETFASSTPDLVDHLRWQLGVSHASDDIKEVAEMIIGNIDSNGYLQATVEELVGLLNVDASMIKKGIALVQGFDPAGVCSRDLVECLMIQVNMLGLGGTLVENIIRHNLTDLEKKKYQAIANQYKVPLEDVLAAVRIIEGLEPKPGRIYSNAVTSYVTPDVYVEKVDDEYKILLYDDNLPKVRLNKQYKNLFADKSTLEKVDKNFLSEKYKAAVWLLKSLEQRQKTIYRVTESILKWQRDFFEKGVTYLKPLNLKDVAEDISMHESNISRVTSNKYLSCSHGIFPFRYFFSSSLPSQTGTVSSTSVKDMIKRIIDEEDKSNPLNDQKIVDMLASKDIKIARRTMAKYREELGIPPHTRRKGADDY
ncbi:MAG: RNA polymerase factor sigma-54 [Nitrospirae bacterium]|nr:RNA polymerase factor sigma-54 [Nitrospirota bacterium]